MKSLFYSLVFLLFIINLNAQPDLICSYLYNNQKSMYRGDYFTLQFKIKNNGTSNAAKTHSSIYLVDSISNSAFYLSDISTEAINSGDSSYLYSFIYPLPYSLSDGTKYIKLVANADSEITESNTANNISYCANKISIIPSYYINKQNLPYPVILMHGWCGKDTSWYSFLRDIENYYGYSYGGNLDFCLNQDGDFTKANLTTDIKDWTNINQLYSGDFYTINFDIDSSGTKYAKSNYSNQSAAIKQGIAMKKAIQHVLEVTGKDKVILVAHSMGGLASREYLQNLTQSDGRHHVAKLFTPLETAD